MDVGRVVQEILQMHIDNMSQNMDAVEKQEAEFEVPEIEEKKFEILCNAATDVFSKEESLLEIQPPITIIGDLHGQLFDLYQIFRRFDIPPAHKYLFLGDLVDRGSYSNEIVSLVFALKVLYPKNIYIIRGNHEFECTSLAGGFFTEIIDLYHSDNLFKAINSVFNYIPIAAKIGPIFCVHGGLSPDFRSLSQVKNLKRPITSYDNPVLTGIFWSDPSMEPTSFSASRRGTGFYFNEKPLRKFLKHNHLTTLVRGHECVDGVKVIWNHSLITVFSASSYCGCQNRSGILNIDSEYRMGISTFGPFRSIKRNERVKKRKRRLSKSQSGAFPDINVTLSTSCLKPYILTSTAPIMRNMQKMSRTNTSISTSVVCLPKI